MNELTNSQALKKFKVLLLGDQCRDIYKYGTVDRLSPEAPVPIFKETFQEEKNGMAGNVEKNLTALGIDVVSLVGYAGKKIRLIDQKSKQHLLRIDEEQKIIPIEFNEILNILNFSVDAIVISDYNKGSITYELVSQIKKKFTVPIFIDTKKSDLSQFEGCYVKINQFEYQQSTSVCNNLIVTLGSQGAKFQDVIYPTCEVDVVDVCGAGDTFLSALAFEYLNTKNIEHAIKFANKASSVTVKHVGVYAPTLEEIG